MGAIIPVFIPHVGCPHDCVFCNQKKIAGTVTAPCGAEVEKIIARDLGNIPGTVAQIAFYGGSFTAIERNLMLEYLAAAKKYIDMGLASDIRLSTRPDCIDNEVLGILKEYGVSTIELGAQSMNDDVLFCSGRGHSSDDVRNASVMIKENGFKLILQMMTHLPGADDEKDIYTAEEIIKLSPDGVRIYPTVVVKETGLEDMMQKGAYEPTTPETAAKLGGVLLEMFFESGIPVIRFGLNPTDDLSGGDAICGAYHPALGEMALSELYLKRCEDEISRLDVSGGELDIFVNPRAVSAMSGQKKKNKKELASKYGFKKINICGDADIKQYEVCIRYHKSS